MRSPRTHRPGDHRLTSAIDALLWFVAIGTVATTLTLSLGPAPSALDAFPLADKALHAAAYAAMTLSWLLAAVWRPGRGRGVFGDGAVAVVTCAVLLGAGIEVAQHFVDRTADIVDGLADLAGAIAGLGAWVGIRSLARPGTAA